MPCIDTVQGFYFALMQYSPIQAFTARFVPFMQLYSSHRKTAHVALQALFLRFSLFHRPRYQTDTSGYNTTCATLERTHAPGRTPAHTRYHTPRRTPYRPAQPPIIIRYIRVQRCAPIMDPCQTVQRITDYANPAGSASPPVQGQQSGRTGWRPPPGGAVRRQEQGWQRGTIGGYRRSSFRAFAR